MGSLIELRNNLKKINVNNLLDESINELSGKIISMNIRDQLFDKGIDSMGQPIQPPYAGLTKSYKRRKGQPVNRVTLKDTGDFYSKFKLNIHKDFVQLLSTDWKTPKLTEKYGEDIFGLAEINIIRLSQLIANLTIKKYRLKLNI